MEAFLPKDSPYSNFSVKDYQFIVKRLRNFFESKGFVEVYAQGVKSILSACEDPESIVTCTLGGEKWPIPQTGQILLETYLLSHPELMGVFCLTTSYRDEKNPIAGRHESIFPMFEFEARGVFEDLISLNRALMRHLGFSGPMHLVSYEEVCQKYNTKLIEPIHEEQISEDYGKVTLLAYFPEETNPFWNMKRDENGVASKIDVIVCGQETIGSSERSCDPQEMWEKFHTLCEGRYSQKLYDEFGKDRVEKELESFLSYKFFERYGGGIGLYPRLYRGMAMEGLINPKEEIY